ncbi:hypothetical protein D9M73_159950 [compost metagenome]
MAKRSGRNVSTPFSSRTWVYRSSIGSLLPWTMCLPVNSTSASIARQRSVRNSSTGSTLSDGWRVATPRACWPARESAPISGAKSAKCSCSEVRVPESFGRGWLAT